jgi:hypothetical protein
VLCAAKIAAIAARRALREARNLLPFAIYCLAFGALSIVRFA